MNHASVTQAVFAAHRRGPVVGSPQWRAFVATVVLACSLPGCAAPGLPRRPTDRELEAVARPILEMHPDANWTACYNRLLELGPGAVDYLLRQPIMQRPAAPDDLRVALHTSLLRLLANPIAGPRLSVNCFETTLDVLHFDPKVRGQRLGEVYLPTRRLPAAWHDLYPAGFHHDLAAEIDVEGDRRTMLRWWRDRRAEPAASLARRPLQPRPPHLWAVLSRRYADVWTYELRPQVILCALPPTGSALLRGRTHDYNFVRAVCIWLGTSDAPGVQFALIELVAHRSPVVAHNARFALRHSPDPRIREVLERHDEAVRPMAALSASCSLGATQPLEFARPSPPSAPASLLDELASAGYQPHQVHVRFCH